MVRFLLPKIEEGGNFVENFRHQNLPEVGAEDRMLSVRDLCNFLGISAPTAYKLTEEPGFPVLRIGRRKIISQRGLMEWIAKGNGGVHAAGR